MKILISVLSILFFFFFYFYFTHLFSQNILFSLASLMSLSPFHPTLFSCVSHMFLSPCMFCFYLTFRTLGQQHVDLPTQMEFIASAASCSMLRPNCFPLYSGFFTWRLLFYFRSVASSLWIQLHWLENQAKV